MSATTPRVGVPGRYWLELAPTPKQLATIKRLARRTGRAAPADPTRGEAAEWISGALFALKSERRQPVRRARRRQPSPTGGNWREKRPTPAQEVAVARIADELGWRIPPHMTRGDAADLIDGYLAKYPDRRGAFRRRSP